MVERIQDRGRNPQAFVGVVHRLDRRVGGLMVYAKTPVAASRLSQQIANQGMIKEYIALVHGQPPERGDWQPRSFSCHWTLVISSCLSSPHTQHTAGFLAVPSCNFPIPSLAL
ncbi:MAG TPA: hypothetical protein DCY74_07755 [Clostridiales bacterium]|jgi:23S rRNA-/tRNA-specific pseudouridylate synthase|nr:hypothetical protein [Clostridiales bacterium]HBE14049.1 hypothetical protein [Clostridiales bacterium]HCG34807.1 hypothetical protein [Clostridiales bacterium]